MSNVIIAIVVMIIGFVLAGYGVYDNVQASKRTSLAMTIGAKISRLAVDAQELREDVGHAPLGPSEEASTGFATYSLETLQRESFGAVSFRYHALPAGYFVCATSTDVSLTMQEAMRMVAKDRPPAFVSGACGVTSTAIGAEVVTSWRIGS